MKCCEYVHLGPCCWDNLFSRVKWQWHICTTTDNYTAIHFQVSALFVQGFTQPFQMKAAGNCSELKKIQAPHDLGVRYLICLATYVYSNRIKKLIRRTISSCISIRSGQWALIPSYKTYELLHTDQSPFQFQNGLLSFPSKVFHWLHNERVWDS